MSSHTAFSCLFSSARVLATPNLEDRRPTLRNEGTHARIDEMPGTAAIDPDRHHVVTLLAQGLDDGNRR